MKILAGILLITGMIFSAPLTADPVSFRIDTNHSNIGFSVPISGGFSDVHGKFSKFDMDLVYDPEDITNSEVSVEIDASSIDTGIDQRDAHLRTSDFFDVEKHPKITFQSSSVTKTGDRLTMTGDFTMRGVTREITIPFKITGKGSSEDGSKIWMGFFAELSLDRRDYNVNYQHQSVPGFIGNQVSVYLSILTRTAALKSTRERIQPATPQ